MLTCCTSIPRASKSVEMRIRDDPERNSRMIKSRSFWSKSACMQETVKSRFCSSSERKST